MSTPPMAGPNNRVTLKLAECNAIALVRSERGTRSPTTLARAGLSKAAMVPRKNTSAAMSQNSSNVWPVRCTRKVPATSASTAPGVIT